jgi:hypothetical protein
MEDLLVQAANGVEIVLENLKHLFASVEEKFTPDSIEKGVRVVDANGRQQIFLGDKLYVPKKLRLPTGIDAHQKSS